tara:strand:- start:4056 stop:4898 length:843 start_codon:yes stop_codon:yes gene_type:complete
MSELTQVEEKASNPYNMNKPWHKPDGPPVDTADQLFFERPQQQATLEDDEAPEEERTAAPKKRTNYKKRYDDLKQHYDNKVNEFKQREQELLAQSTPSYTAPKTQKDLERFRQEYPDLYDTVETVAHLHSSEQVTQLQGQLEAIQEREQRIIRREAEADLIAKHPDFDEIRGSDSFHEWAETQPEQIQAWIYNNPDNVQLASKAIDLFKLENGIRTQTKSQSRAQNQGSAADIVSTKTKTIDAKEPKIWTEREIAAMSLDKFDKYEQEIQQAISEGRVVK